MCFGVCVCLNIFTCFHRLSCCFTSAEVSRTTRLLDWKVGFFLLLDRRYACKSKSEPESQPSSGWISFLSSFLSAFHAAFFSATGSPVQGLGWGPHLGTSGRLPSLREFLNFSSFPSGVEAIPHFRGHNTGQAATWPPSGNCSGEGETRLYL